MHSFADIKMIVLPNRSKENKIHQIILKLIFSY